MPTTTSAKAPVEKVRRQYGVVPWYRTKDGDVRVVLITTRETGRWSIPRGNPMKGRKPYEAAGIEAYEEAGVLGRAGKKPLGSYDYDKRVGATTVAVRVKVFPFRVSKRVDAWPEREERSVRDFSVAEASSVIKEAGLASIVRAFAPRRGLGSGPAAVPARDDPAPPRARKAGKKAKDGAKRGDAKATRVGARAS